jgi:hypothetical protein
LVGWLVVMVVQGTWITLVRAWLQKVLIDSLLQIGKAVRVQPSVSSPHWFV